jgi:hypothetical protein
MRNTVAAVAFICVLGGGSVALRRVGSHASNETGPCAPANTMLAQDLMSLYRWTMGGDDSVRVKSRELMDIPKVDSMAIGFVSDTAICRAAVIAYTRVLQDTAEERSVHVIKIGNRYLVSDPLKWAGQVAPTVTFDSTFANMLARVLQ